jgi:hypothetical protein
MRGHPKFNFPAFDNLAAYMRSEGWDVDSPAEHDRTVFPDIEEWPGYADGDPALCPKFNYSVSMRWDITRVVEDDAIVLLPNWWTSTGAKFERFVAEQCDRLVYVAVPCLAGDAIVTWSIYPDVAKRLTGPTVKPTEEQGE